ncbi:hypothetical protein A3J20_01890 [Candidatus Gottesmanbacteria bacterium RIFCSPLOWO2_02_FULL_42_29]|nr:MAG: hypothetical protein A3J20_01890 [Candidatus Gottesmanbacteria bacterium RIFCSPLOWO2_02_FULL_42_29]
MEIFEVQRRQKNPYVGEADELVIYKGGVAYLVKVRAGENGGYTVEFVKRMETGIINSVIAANRIIEAHLSSDYVATVVISEKAKAVAAILERLRPAFS